jgi:predicted S18 family serine protease
VVKTLSRSDIEEARDKIREQVQVLKDRIVELGDEDVMTYRHDETIMNAIENICALYTRIHEECEYLDERSEPMCGVFREEPEILKRLELTEEELCPLRVHASLP